MPDEDPYRALDELMTSLNSCVRYGPTAVCSSDDLVRMEIS